MTVLDTGDLVDLDQRLRDRPPEFADPADLIAWKWPIWCHENGMAYKEPGGKWRVPAFLGWRRDGNIEEFHVGLPSGWSAPKFTAQLAEFLPSAQQATAAVPIDLEDGTVRFVLSHFRLPEVLDFDPARIPTSPNVVYLGLLIEGSDFLWDLRDFNHGLIAGQTNSGKTETVGTILTQLHLKGWALRVATPKYRDSKYQAFDDAGHPVITGMDDDHLEAVIGMLEAEQAEQKARADELAEVRSTTRTEVEFYGDPVDGYEWELPPSLLLIDECPDYLEPAKGGNDPQRHLKNRVRYLWEQRITKGREYRQHCLAATQTPTVDSVGGGRCMAQMGFRVAIRNLSQDYVHRVFPKSTSPSLDTLTDGSLPPGRAIGRGAAPPDNALAGKAINDAPMQLAYWPRVQREQAITDPGHLPTPAPRAPVDLVRADHNHEAPRPVPPDHLKKLTRLYAAAFGSVVVVGSAVAAVVFT